MFFKIIIRRLAATCSRYFTALSQILKLIIHMKNFIIKDNKVIEGMYGNVREGLELTWWTWFAVPRIKNLFMEKVLLFHNC